MSRRVGIQDRAVSNAVTANEATGALDLTFLFVDEVDPHLKAQVSIEIAPEEAIDLIDRMIAELGKLGVRIRPTDEGAETQTRSGAG